MKMRRISLALAVTLLGCGYVRSLFPHRAPLEEDKSIVFPEFFKHVAVEIGAQGKPYEMDGEMLRALVIASNDYLPLDDSDIPCTSRKEAQFYRVIRQGSIIFVYIYWNHEYCGYKYPAFDSGIKYAISADGRILRRLLDGQPDGPIEPETPDAGRRRIKAEPGVSSEFEAMWNSRRDGGTVPSRPRFPPAPLPATDGGSAVPDGGSSGGDAG